MAHSSDRTGDWPPEFLEAFAAFQGRFGRLAGERRFLDIIGSTNDVVSAMAAAGAREGLVVIADAQTAGRGRRGRTWCSPPGAGLYVSLLLTPGRAGSDPARATALLTLAAGVALAQGVEAATGLAADIKWPNDLLVGRRKLAGILAEGLVGGGDDGLQVVLGFGINVRPAAYPSDVSSRATSLETELGRPVDRGLVCAHTLAALSERYDDLLNGRFDAILDGWRRRAPGCHGSRVRWHDAQGMRTGVTAGIDETGALLVQAGDALQRLVAGEVLWD
ncbi:MAG: biotin--[acetyl-CoA-carboxylase] ligase [Vicinamibacterales bacterium]